MLHGASVEKSLWGVDAEVTTKTPTTKKPTSKPKCTWTGLARNVADELKLSRHD